MSDAITQAIEAAKHAQEHAEKLKNQTSVATVSAGNTSVGAPSTPAPKLNMETVNSGQMTVDAWLKAKEYGLLLGDVTALFPSCIASISMVDGSGFVVKKGIKGGNPAKYAYTTDGETCTSGGGWPQAVEKMKALDGKAYEYRCVDLPMVLLEDIVVDGKTLHKAGIKMGYTTSTTNWKAWTIFFEDCKAQGLLGEDVKVKLGFARRENTAKNVWGIVTFELVGSMVDETAGAE